MRLSVLDQSTIASGRTADQAIRETLALARHCDALGYHRYWMAEHHNTPSQAGTAPEVLSAAIAITTQRIRVGTAGVMLPHNRHRETRDDDLIAFQTGGGNPPFRLACQSR